MAMKSFAVISLLASAVYAQSSGSSASTASALIPSGISSGCTAFLNKLDNDTTLLACSSTLVKATSAFSTANSTASANSTKINSALNSLCNSTSSCSQSLLRTALTGFYGACQLELTTNSNTEVINTYDVLYSISPLTQAVCSKSDTGNYCVVEMGKNASSLSSASGVASTPSTDMLTIQKYLSSPVTPGSNASGVYPNITTFGTYNIPFLLLQPTLQSSSLCVSCTRSIISSYINFESAIPYGPGLKQSSLLSGQTSLYQAVMNTCGATFLSGTVQAAGGLSGGLMKGGAVNVAANYKAIGAALAAVALGLHATL